MGDRWICLVAPLPAHVSDEEVQGERNLPPVYTWGKAEALVECKRKKKASSAALTGGEIEA